MLGAVFAVLSALSFAINNAAARRGVITGTAIQGMAITVPMGYTRRVLPAGLQFFGRPWSEETLIRLAYSYEQVTHWRRPPSSTGG